MSAEERTVKYGVDACIVGKPEAICDGTYAIKDLEGSKKLVRKLGIGISCD